MIDSGMNSKNGNLLKNGDYSHFFYDKIVFSKIKDAFGGKVRLMIAGGAPLSVKTYLFMETLMSCPLY